MLLMKAQDWICQHASTISQFDILCERQVSLRVKILAAGDTDDRGHATHEACALQNKFEQTVAQPATLHLRKHIDRNQLQYRTSWIVKRFDLIKFARLKRLCASDALGVRDPKHLPCLFKHQLPRRVLRQSLSKCLGRRTQSLTPALEL